MILLLLFSNELRSRWGGRRGVFSLEHAVDSQILLSERHTWACRALRKSVQWRNCQVLLHSYGRPMGQGWEANSGERKPLKESWRKRFEVKRLWALEPCCLGLNPSQLPPLRLYDSRKSLLHSICKPGMIFINLF